MNDFKAKQPRRVLRQLLSEFAWAGFVLRRRLKSRTLGLKRVFVRPKLPNNPDGKILIHLGCGDIASPEFINVDARPAPHLHYVRDARDLSIFPDGYADLVYASHVLEHMPSPILKNVLWEWRRILKPDGVLRLSVPDFDALLDIYQACGHDIDSIAARLMGGQDYAENIHYSVFNSKYLSRLLIEVGFRSVRKWDPQKVDHHDFEDWASGWCLQRC